MNELKEAFFQNNALHLVKNFQFQYPLHKQLSKNPQSIEDVFPFNLYLQQASDNQQKIIIYKEILSYFKRKISDQSLNFFQESIITQFKFIKSIPKNQFIFITFTYEFENRILTVRNLLGQVFMLKILKRKLSTQFMEIFRDINYKGLWFVYDLLTTEQSSKDLLDLFRKLTQHHRQGQILVYFTRYKPNCQKIKQIKEIKKFIQVQQHQQYNLFINQQSFNDRSAFIANYLLNQIQHILFKQMNIITTKLTQQTNINNHHHVYQCMFVEYFRKDAKNLNYLENITKFIKIIQHKLQFTQKMDSKQKTAQNKHFPKLISNNKCKRCRNCGLKQHHSNNKTHKSRYCCIACSIRTKGQFVLCVLCFQQFHENLQQNLKLAIQKKAKRCNRSRMIQKAQQDGSYFYNNQSFQSIGSNYASNTDESNNIMQQQQKALSQALKLNTIDEQLMLMFKKIQQLQTSNNGQYYVQLFFKTLVSKIQTSSVRFQRRIQNQKLNEQHG